MNKMSAGIKYDQDKVRMELLSSKALVRISRVLTQGASKYVDHNWRKGLAWSRIIGAALRHLIAFNDGEDNDPERGESHLAHAACCVMFLLEYLDTHKELDDRYKVANKESAAVEKFKDQFKTTVASQWDAAMTRLDTGRETLTFSGPPTFNGS